MPSITRIYYCLSDLYLQCSQYNASSFFLYLRQHDSRKDQSDHAKAKNVQEPHTQNEWSADLISRYRPVNGPWHQEESNSESKKRNIDITRRREEEQDRRAGAGCEGFLRGCITPDSMGLITKTTVSNSNPPSAASNTVWTY